MHCGQNMEVYMSASKCTVKSKVIGGRAHIYMIVGKLHVPIPITQIGGK